MTVPVGVLLLLAALYAAKHKGSDAPGMMLGLCLGVQGSNGVIGQLVRPLIQVGVQAATSLVHALPQ